MQLDSLINEWISQGRKAQAPGVDEANDCCLPSSFFSPFSCLFSLTPHVLCSFSQHLLRMLFVWCSESLATGVFLIRTLHKKISDIYSGLHSTIYSCLSSHSLTLPASPFEWKVILPHTRTSQQLLYILSALFYAHLHASTTRYPS